MIVLNEKEYAERCLSEKIIDRKPFKTLSILAKYYYHHCGYKPKKIKELLIDFLSSTYELYYDNKESWGETIDKIAKNVHKYKLYEIDGVWITSAELESIESIHNTELEMVAFTMLCLAKLSILKNNTNPGWVNLDSKEIFEMANVKCSKENTYFKLNKLIVNGMLDYATRIDNLSLKVLYINNDSENILFVNDFRNLGYEYLMYEGDNYVRCKECGIVIRNNKNKTRGYCDDCAGYIPQKKKIITCVDCGKEFEVDAFNNKTKRCDSCQKIYRKVYKAEKERERRNKDV